MASSGEVSNVARLELLVHEDKLPQQAISYMENIDFHPTLPDVTQQTMVLEVCGNKKYAIAIAIPKPALQIEIQQSPRYDNVFICSDTFHLFRFFRIYSRFVWS